jgi:hypothetical protein
MDVGRARELLRVGLQAVALHADLAECEVAPEASGFRVRVRVGGELSKPQLAPESLLARAAAEDPVAVRAVLALLKRCVLSVEIRQAADRSRQVRYRQQLDREQTPGPAPRGRRPESDGAPPRVP